MKWTDIPHGKINAAQLRFWEALGDEADTVALRLKTDLGFAAHLAAFALNPGFADKSTTSLNYQWLCARKIMDRNFFGVEEAMGYFKINPSKQQLANLAEIPFTEELLRSVKNTHVLVAVFPLSILGIRRKVDRKHFMEFEGGKDAWWGRQEVAKRRNGNCWRLIRKTPLPESDKELEEQMFPLAVDEVVPTIQAVVYMVIGHFLATDERLFDVSAVQCEGGVLSFREEGLDIATLVDSSDNSGFASEKKRSESCS